MRQAAEEYLKDFPRFISHDGTAENTNLADSSIDFVIAAQAFHWFDADKTRDEFRRILKPGGYVALIWNERQLDTTEFLREYEKLLLKYAKDYEKVRHENIDQQKLGFLSGRIPARASHTGLRSRGTSRAAGHHRICRPKTTHHFRPLKRTAKRFLQARRKR